MPPGTMAGVEKPRVKYLVVIEKGPASYGAYAPDLPGCVAVAKTRREARTLIREAMQLHLAEMRNRGERIPKPSAAADLFELES